jgi:hypothetical protein
MLYGHLETQFWEKFARELGCLAEYETLESEK